jgi:hypothetical protein
MRLIASQLELLRHFLNIVRMLADELGDSAIVLGRFRAGAVGAHLAKDLSINGVRGHSDDPPTVVLFDDLHVWILKGKGAEWQRDKGAKMIKLFDR